MSFLVGIDVGKRNPGLARLDRGELKCDLLVDDMCTVDGIKYSPNSHQMIDFVTKYIERNQDKLKDAQLVGIEWSYKYTDEMKLIAHDLYAGIAGKGYRVCWVHADKWRKFFGICNKSHAKNKKVSLSVPIMSDSHKKIVRELFNGGKSVTKLDKNDSEQVDAYEAALIAYYMHANFDKLMEDDEVKSTGSKFSKKRAFVLNIPLVSVQPAEEPAKKKMKMSKTEKKPRATKKKTTTTTTTAKKGGIKKKTTTPRSKKKV